MKKNLLAILSLLCVMAFSTSCSESESTKKDASAATPAAKAAKAAADLPNYRYVDIDTILSKYKLAIDYSDEMLRMQSNLENEAKKHENNIKAFANSMQHKYQNNQYTSEQAFNADQTKLQQMQTNAQSSMEKMQRSNLEAAAAADKVVQDSIHNFIERYNARHHYDAILLKGATLYINPALDITEEVVEGLNAGYTKVKK
ncbi:MAG: OmpH family outer membrane protein [Muribaculaceae bacterium]|nr:OmpH family outer membrane protein [Muribaculaceae bacterium]